MAAADTARLIAALELQDKFSGTAAKYERAIGQMERKTSTFSKISSEAGRGVSNLATNVARIGVFAGGAAVVGITKAVSAASELQQATGAAESVLGKHVESLKAWGEQAAESAGLSRREVLQTGAVVAAQLQGMNFAQDEAAEHTVALQKRAADLAATFGGTTKDALEAISSLLRGERDPIEKYGVSLKQVDINARVTAKGLDTSTAAAKKQSEAIAALELLMEQTAKTEGQFARETDTLAGSQARFRANIENTGAMIGTALLPQLSKLTARFNDMLAANQPAIAAFAERLPAVFERIEGLVTNLPWGAIGTTFQLMGAGADALLTTFTAMPAWVQTAVLTGWGLNKLTGGALGNIVGELGKGLIKGVLGMNAAVVNINAATVNGPGGGVPGVGGKGGGFLGSVGRGLGTGLAVGGAAVAVGAAAVTVANFQDMRTEATGKLETVLDSMPQKTGAEIDESISRIEGEINKERPFLEGILFNTNVKPQLEKQIEELREMRFGTDSLDQNIITTAQRIADQNSILQSSKQAASFDAVMVRNATSGLGSRIDRVANTPHNVNVDNDITIPVNVSATVLANQTYRTTTIQNSNQRTQESVF